MLSVTDLSADFANLIASAVAVLNEDDIYLLGSGSATGELEESEDVDWYSARLKAGTTYRIDLEGAFPAGAGNLIDPYLRGVHDSNGDLIAGTTDNDGGWGINSRVIFTPPEDATYYVAAGVNEHWRGTYALSVLELSSEDDDFAAGTGTTGAVRSDGLALGEIETGGDVDWFVVTLEAGTRYRIDLEGSHTRDDPLEDPCLRGVHDANGDLIPGTTNDDGGRGANSRLTFTPTEAGTYHVAAGASADGVGTYLLSVVEDAM